MRALVLVAIWRYRAVHMVISDEVFSRPPPAKLLCMCVVCAVNREREREGERRQFAIYRYIHALRLNFFLMKCKIQSIVF